MSNYYSDDTALSKKEKLGQYLEAISTALDKINGVTISESWQCSESDDINLTLEELKGKITSIKELLTSYESFLIKTNNVYSDVSSEINASLSSYHGEM